MKGRDGLPGEPGRDGFNGRPGIITMTFHPNSGCVQPIGIVY